MTYIGLWDDDWFGLFKGHINIHGLINVKAIVVEE